jgi:small subunit ribosomal protein S17
MAGRKELIGTVISDKMQKTRVVRILRMAKHPKYGRILKKYIKFKVHDEANLAKLGDLVKIQETRPLSKDKHFKLVEVVKKSAVASVEIADPVV